MMQNQIPRIRVQILKIKTQNLDDINSGMSQFAQKVPIFLLLTSGIYACYLITGLFHQQILKTPYTHITTSQKAYFNDPLIFTLFPPLVATIFGKIILIYKQKVNHESITEIPWRRTAYVGIIINVCSITYNLAVIYASFPAIIMVKSCSLLSVIMVGVFCSGVKDKALKLSKQKILIGIIATLGIFLFNSQYTEKQTSINHPISVFSLGTLFLAISLIGDGFLPDFQARIKEQFKPTSIEFYFHANQITFIICLTISIITNQIWNILLFLTQYHQFFRDIFIFSVLNGIGQLFIYKMLNEFRQHVPAFVIAIRKCLTVIINITFFGHSINLKQMGGIGLVFVAVMWEVYSNMKGKEKKNACTNFEENDQEKLSIQVGNQEIEDDGQYIQTKQDSQDKL